MGEGSTRDRDPVELGRGGGGERALARCRGRGERERAGPAGQWDRERRGRAGDRGGEGSGATRVEQAGWRAGLRPRRLGLLAWRLARGVFPFF